MNIKRTNGKMVCIQKNGYRTLCGQSFTIRLYNRQTGLFDSVPSYVETDEPCICKKCLEMAMAAHENQI